MLSLNRYRCDKFHNETQYFVQLVLVNIKEKNSFITCIQYGKHSILCKKGGKVTGSKGVEEEVGITDTHPHQAGHTCNPGRRTESSRPA